MRPLAVRMPSRRALWPAAGLAALALGCPTLLVARMSSSDPRARHLGVSHHTRTVLRLLLGRVGVAAPAGAEPPAEAARHDWRVLEPDLEGYRRSGLPTRTMGRTMEEDPLFFGSALAAGARVAEMIHGSDG